MWGMISQIEIYDRNHALMRMFEQRTELEELSKVSIEIL